MIPEINSLHIEPTNICTLKCSGCARTRFIDQWPQHWQNHNLDVQDLSDFLDINIKGKKFLFGGNYGDPIYHPRFHDMISMIKGRGGIAHIVTNGSHRKSEWWVDLCDLLTEDDNVIFSIDGTPENFHIYRENGDWSSIKTAIDICTKSLTKTTWKYIPFRFNQNDIELARALSKEFGIDEFLVTPSDRFDEHTQHLMPDSDKLGRKLFFQEEFKKGKALSVNPKCHRGSDHFITATGHYSPCCYLADHRFYYKTLFGKEKSLVDITTTTITKLLSHPKIVEFYAQIPVKPIGGCQYNCPS